MLALCPNFKNEERKNIRLPSSPCFLDHLSQKLTGLSYSMGLMRRPSLCLCMLVSV